MDLSGDAERLCLVPYTHVPPAGLAVRDNPASVRVRIIVVLPNGSKVVIPMEPTSKVSELEAETVRRATVLRLPFDPDSVLRLGSRTGAIAFGDDSIEDVLDLADNSTFWFSSIQNSSQAAGIDSEWTQVDKKEYEIFIRWITPARAMRCSKLSGISPDFSPVSSKTTVSQLRTTAFDRLFRGLFPGEEKPLLNTTTELFLTSCHLSTSNASSVSLADLKLEGTLQNPLNIFLVQRKTEASSPTTPYTTWAFTRTERGTAAFFTSLKVLLREIKTKGGLQEILKVLWEVTHFPPALTAFHQLHDTQDFLPLPCAILATCVRELALAMVPAWIADSRDMALESSRQIFAWLYSLYSEASKQPAGSAHALVHTVTLSEVDSDSSSNSVDGMPIDYVSFVASGGPKPQSPPSSERVLRRVSVVRERTDEVASCLLAVSQWGSYEAVSNYYVNWPTGLERYFEYDRFPLLDPSDFNSLLTATNRSDAFKLVGPHQLGKAILPVISLNKDGYVAVYDLLGKACGEFYPTTWNIISGYEPLSSTDPGQFLAQKLQTIIAQRKKMHSWEVDAWTEDAALVGLVGSPEEAIVICVDRSGSMESAMDCSWMPNSRDSRTANMDLSRLSEVKEVFQNFVARTAAYKIATHLGLVVFSGRADVSENQSITPVLYDFKDRLMDIVPTGLTAIWDALMQAKLMLLKFAVQNPTTKLRIIMLTDGEDNHSVHQASMVCSELCDANIVLDSIVIGTTSTDSLFKISKHTGGYAFCPKTRGALFQIFLLETFVDIRMRPDIVRVPIGNFSTSTPKLPDMTNSFNFPQCRQHPHQNDTFISLREGARAFQSLSQSSVFSGHGSGATLSVRTPSISSWDAMTLNSRSNDSVSTGASGAHRIILHEVRQMAANQHPYMDVYISESNMGFWKVVMQGPPASPYSSGTFALYIEMGDGFPRQAPTARFLTPVLHPNITKHGRICHAIFDRDWNPEMHIYEVLQSVYGILMTLEVRDAVDPLSTLKFWTDPESSKIEVLEYIQRFARLDRLWHKRKILESG